MEFWFVRFVPKYLNCFSLFLLPTFYVVILVSSLIPRRDHVFSVFTSRPISLLLFIIGIQTLGWFGQSPELSQATGMALVCCILGKFLGVVCHCFPPHLDVPTFATRCLLLLLLLLLPLPLLNGMTFYLLIVYWCHFYYPTNALNYIKFRY